MQILKVIWQLPVLALALGLGLPSTTVRAQSAVETSPVALTDFVEWTTAVDRVNALPATRAFRDFVSLMYDNQVGRPWGDAWWPELQLRWGSLRESACPVAIRLCSLPARLDNTEALMQVVRGLQARETRADWESFFEREGATVHAVDFAQNDSDTAPSFLIGGRESITHVSASIWDMQAPDLVERRMEFLALEDVGSYGASWSMAKAPRYFGFVRDHELVFNVDKIKSSARRFAAIWKMRVETPNDEDDFDSAVSKRLSRDLQTQFHGQTELLAKKLAQLSSPAATETRTRFDREQEAGLYPEETYQWMAFELFSKLVEQQGRYFVLARAARDTISPKRQIWESLLSLQSEVGAIATLYFLYNESSVPASIILDQYVNPSVGPLVLLESLHAVLGLEEFANHSLYAELGHVFAAMSDLPADREQRRAALARMLQDSDGSPSRSGIMKLSRMLISNISEADGRKLARHIHAVRFATTQSNQRMF